jgi:hypothetical protein
MENIRQKIQAGSISRPNPNLVLWALSSYAVVLVATFFFI